MIKLTPDQLTLPLSANARADLVAIIASSAAEAIFDDGYDSILSLLLEGCTGVEKYTDEELVAEYLEEFACEEDEVK